MGPSEFDGSHCRFQNVFSELSEQRSNPERVTIPPLERNEDGHNRRPLMRDVIATASVGRRIERP